ncbi:hypothetical protein B0H63DRAFT_56740 [Podospora didyma]|uniref:Glycosyltransferase family 28 N-terminal domain-containing protein n=1 Tax=Podospora didyma TaxID=330526 RepID=A0AAE0P7I6_9PEZI|nr:hypothetical protein B0H63DRAFT_56740 [Podospora didyma]
MEIRRAQELPGRIASELQLGQDAVVVPDQRMVANGQDHNSTSRTHEKARNVRLNIAMLIVGSTEDAGLFTSVAVWLRDKFGHRVRVATHPEFQSMVEACGLDFLNLGGKSCDGPGGKSFQSRGSFEAWKLALPGILQASWSACVGPRRDGRAFVADAVIANFPSFAHIHCAERLGVPLHILSVRPWTPTRLLAHPLAHIDTCEVGRGLANLLSYALVELMLWREIHDPINNFRREHLNLGPIDLLHGPGLLQRLTTPTTYFKYV